LGTLLPTGHFFAETKAISGRRFNLRLASMRKSSSIATFPSFWGLTIWPSARQLVRQGGGVAAPLAGQGRPGWAMAAHQLASAYKKRPKPELQGTMVHYPCWKNRALLCLPLQDWIRASAALAIELP